MGFLIILPLGTLAGWSIFAIFRWLRQGGYEKKWWRAFGILTSVGFGLGIWLAFFFEYKVANIHMQGFPIPVVILSRQKPDDPWIKSDMPISIRLGGWTTDVLSGIALCLVPIAGAAFLKENRGKGPHFTPRAQNPP